jgi:peptidoglycan/LPS O-acetylase OafA/YrhL
MWIWRLGLVVVAFVCTTLRFQFAVGYQWTLNLAAIYMFLWIGQEIQAARQSPPSQWLERAGLWSYSLYLCHVPALALVGLLALPNFGNVANWLIVMGVIMALSYTFYRAIERPAHVLARWVGKACSQQDRRQQASATPLLATAAADHA